MSELTNTELGMNRTGAKVSPIDSKLTKEGAEQLTTAPTGGRQDFTKERMSFINEWDTVGSVPMPTSLKGMVAGAQEKLMTGGHAFMDKLGERIAFERTGTRLYEALLAKYDGLNSSDLPARDKLMKFYQEELKHFQMCCQVMDKLGGDPTAMTPCADVAGTAAIGWVQTISDPRTSFDQSLNIILQAELVDNAGWELLIKLAEAAGLKDIGQQFRQAMLEEAIHLASVKQWVQELTMNEKVTTKGTVTASAPTSDLRQ